MNFGYGRVSTQVWEWNKNRHRAARFRRLFVFDPVKPDARVLIDTGRAGAMLKGCSE